MKRFAFLNTLRRRQGDNESRRRHHRHRHRRVGQTGTDRPSPVTPIENLYLVGADVGRDNIGTELAAQSALRLEGILEERGAI